MEQDLHFDLKSKTIPKETFILTSKINNKKIINNLINYVKNNINLDLSHKTHVKGKFTGFESLIHNNDFYEFLKNIQPQIRTIYKNNFIIGESWGNICKINEEVTEHNHKGVTAFCGILYLTENGPGTYFSEYDITVEEEIGKFILFSPILMHSVKKICKDVERITIAFNMYETKVWDKDKQIKWVNR
jgi:hypothetical protein